MLKASPVTGSCVYAGDMILEEGWKTVSFNFSCHWGDADSDAEVEEAVVVELERRLYDQRTQLKLSQLEERVRTLTMRLEKEMDANAALNTQLRLMGELRGE